MRFDSPGGWADRKGAAIQAAYRAAPAHRFEFLGSCVMLDGPTIDHITDDDRQEELTYEQFSEVVDLEDFKRLMLYAHEADPEGLRLEDDQTVSYWKSTLPEDHPLHPGALVYFLDHSRIEYIWVETA